MLTIQNDMVLESSNFIMGGTDDEVRQFVSESIEDLRGRGIEITDITERSVSYRLTVGEALEKGFSREVVAALAFQAVYRERADLYHNGEASYFADEYEVYKALGAQLPGVAGEY